MNGEVRAKTAPAPRLGHGVVASALRQEIASGDLSPNEHLVELELAERYGVGRATIRAALLELAGEGLVVREANRGARVRAIERDEAIEIAEVRQSLEGLCAAKAAERATAAERAELVDLLAQLQAALDGGDAGTYNELNRRLHRRIRDLARHETAASTLDRLLRQNTRQSLKLSLLPARLHESHEQHRRLIEAIVAGDAAAAEATMREHLGEVTASLARAWQAPPPR